METEEESRKAGTGKMTSMGRRAAATALMAALALAACDSDPTGGGSVTGGDWSGTAMDSVPLTFTVSGDEVRRMTLEITYDLGQVPDTTVTWVFDADIVNDGFQYLEMTGVTPYSFSLDVSGTFDPPGAVSGTLSTSASYDSAGVGEEDSLAGSWSATPD